MEGRINAEAVPTVSENNDPEDGLLQEKQSGAGYEVAEMLSECFILYESVSIKT